MHIFLTGDVQVGKSTIINKTLAALKIERPGGFRSVSVPDLPDGAMSVYLLAAAEKAPAMGDFNRVGIRKGCGRGIEKFPQAFETAGVQALKNAEQSRLILMDEVGRMESAAAQFSARMEALLDGSVPILGVVQKIADTPLTNAIRTHPNVRVLTVTKENREQMAQEVLRLISKELDRTTDSAGAIVFRGDTVLMIRAGSRWSFPKGHVEPGETLLQAASRETREETGIEAALLEDYPLPVPSAREDDRRTVWFYPARTGLQGFLYFITPHVEGLTVERFLQILLDAMSQLFFSLSVSMGIMITYGSYVKKDVNLGKSVNQIELFDTLVALLAGVMIIPAVYVFSGVEGMGAGPSLMFVSLPKVFDAMGKAGTFVGALFFLTAIFATLTSCISVLESIVANCVEIFRTDRKKTVVVLSVIYLAASAVIALGYSKFYFELPLPNGSVGQLLDLMDYVSNSVMMPFIALLSTILIGWVKSPQYVIGEMERNGETFRRRGVYTIMIRYIAPVMMFVLFLQSTGILS